MFSFRMTRQKIFLTSLTSLPSLTHELEPDHAGRLAQAWPRSVGSIGGPGAPYLYPFQGNHMGESYAAGDGLSSPLFQFGFGLSCKNASNLQLLVMSRHSVH